MLFFMNLNKYLTILFLAISILTLSSCKKTSLVDDAASTTDMGYDYYPIALGNWYIYSVDSIAYDFEDTLYNESYQIKEIYADTFTDTEGRLSYKIERYKRANDSAQWSNSDIWYVTSTSSRVERIEEDVRYEPFVFPPQNETTWDLNSFNNYNTYNEWAREQNKVEIEVKDTLVGQSFVLDTLTSYDNTVTVWHKYETYISYQVYKGVYAKNIGLVYKQMIYYKSNVQSMDPILDRISYGVKCTQSLVSYGTD